MVSSRRCECAGSWWAEDHALGVIREVCRDCGYNITRPLDGRGHAWFNSPAVFGYPEPPAPPAAPAAPAAPARPRFRLPQSERFDPYTEEQVYAPRARHGLAVNGSPVQMPRAPGQQQEDLLFARTGSPERQGCRLGECLGGEHPRYALPVECDECYREHLATLPGRGRQMSAQELAAVAAWKSARA